MQDSFTAFVADRLDRLLRCATALTCDPHLAQDVVQDVLLRAQHHWARIGSMDAPEAYVRRMVTNEYLSWRRRRASRTVASTHGVLDAIGAPTADPSGWYAERDAMRTRIAGRAFVTQAFAGDAPADPDPREPDQGSVSRDLGCDD